MHSGMQYLGLVFAGDQIIVRKILKRRGDDIDVNQALTTDGSTPLYIASQFGHVDTVNVLIKAGGNVNQAKTTDGASPLYMASQQGNVDIVKVLLKAGGNVHQAKTTDGASPLFIASQQGNVDLVKVLIDGGGGHCGQA